MKILALPKDAEGAAGRLMKQSSDFMVFVTWLEDVQKDLDVRNRDTEGANNFRNQGRALAIEDILCELERVSAVQRPGKARK